MSNESNKRFGESMFAGRARRGWHKSPKDPAIEARNAAIERVVLARDREIPRSMFLAAARAGGLDDEAIAILEQLEQRDDSTQAVFRFLDESIHDLDAFTAAAVRQP